MSLDVEVSFDPYLSWLQIQETQRPLNAYQLLGLNPLEFDSLKIRGAVTRMQSLIEAQRNDAPPQLWDRVNAELEEAISTLLDPDRKMLLDATLKRQLNLRAKPATNGTRTESLPTSGKITCRDCSKENPAQRRFCGECGSALYDACPQCHAEIAADERFCGHCGTNQQETRSAQENKFEEKLQEARRLQHRHRYNEAVAVLHSVAVTEDARFERFAAEALRLIEEFALQRKELQDRAERRLVKARKYLERHAYEQALLKLEGIPEPLRTPEIREVHAEARAKSAEVAQLGEEIREALAQKRKYDLLPKIERLLALVPDHQQGRELAEQLREYICKSARQKLATHSYDDARSMLETIPSFARNEEVEKLVDRTRELDSLAMDIRLSPLADDTLLALAERLAKLSPADEQSQKQLAEIKQRRAVRPAEPHLAYSPWATAPRRTLLGLPVDLLSHLSKCDIAPEAAVTLRENPGQFFVAFGLALQAKGQAAVNLNLMPAEKTSLLGNFSIGLRKPQPKAAWGLDLGPTGLRAIKLAAESSSGKVRIEAAVLIPHAKPLAQASDEVTAREMVAATLQTFREKYPIAKESHKRDTVFVSLPGSRSLGRFFELPPVATKRLPDLVQYEAKHQIPIPLEELNWGYHTLREVEGKGADENSRYVMLLAAKEYHVRERLGQFKSAEIVVDGLAAEPLALHNAVSFELLASADEERTIAVIDVGADGSNFVVSSKRSVWFRTSSSSGDDFTAALVKQLQLTTTLAEELKRAPQRARRFYQYYQAISPLLVQFGSDIERSLVSYGKQHPEQAVQQLFLCGGASSTHGLLRHLIHGR